MTQLISQEEALVPGRRLQAMSIQDVMAFKNSLDQLIKNWLLDGVDYMAMPGSRSNTKVLTKSGAEKLCASFGLIPDYEIIDKTIDHNVSMPYQTRYKSGEALGLYRYVIKCHLRDRSGTLVASGIAVCSTTESKYCDRPRDVENTILKMAEKRALVAATLNGLAISGLFTQDIEEVETQARPAAPQQPANHRPSPPPQQARAVAAKKPTFDKNDKKHQEIFMQMMEKYDVPFDKIDDVANALHGRPSADVESCVKSVLGADVQNLMVDDRSVGEAPSVSETV